MGISHNIVTWVKAFLEDRTFHVVVEGAKLKERLARSGVPQGSVLSPLLFLIFINDLAEQLKCPCYMFADDVKLVGDQTTDDLQVDLATIHNWTSMWELPLNENKCIRLIQTNKDTKPRYIGPSLNCTVIPDKTVVWNLGI